MLRIHTAASAAVAKSYFSSADYYSEGQELLGVWQGQGARMLGLSGAVDQKAWDRLCDNLHPMTGTKLTPRQKAERRIGYDLTFDVPKSVSLLYGLTGDERLLEAFRSSVDETMNEIELEARTRVRAGGRDEDRTTGNLVWGQYVHFTSRPVGGVPDPQLHAHCFIFNTTWDGHERKWKAAQLGEIKEDAPYYQAAFDSRLASKLVGLGLTIQRTRTGWELAGQDRSTLWKFSRRTAEIEDLAKQKGLTDPRAKAALGATIRERKAKHISMEELRQHWRSRLTPDESSGLQAQQRSLGGTPGRTEPGAAREAVHLAAEHCFERSSVMDERRLLAEALRRSVGAAPLDAVRCEHARAGFITANRDGRRMVTTREVLAEEARMIEFARSGRGSCVPLGGHEHVFTRDWLNAGQRSAVQHVLKSRDRVMVIRGAAGTGKTSMMQEAVEAIQSGPRGVKAHVFAPSSTASRGVLRDKGFAEADTVSRLLVDEKLQERLRHQVIWIDEAGLVGTRAMSKVFELADRLEARVILSGDRRQHGSVERGAALRLLEEESGLVPAEIKEIQRQKDAYKHAVEALSEGRTEEGFSALDKLGWVREVPDEERYAAMAAEYVDAIKAGKTALVVSPTHAEGELIAQSVRDRLKASGRIGRDERMFPTLDRADMTSADRTDPVRYTPGDVLVFHQNAKGFTKGQRIRLGTDMPLAPLDQADRFQVFKLGVLPLAPGDLIRITHNGQTLDKRHELRNGATYNIKGFTPGGDIVLSNGWVVAKDFGHLAHGYVVTSHASQGRDVQRVLIGQSAQSFRASSREQFYVSASRGTEQVTVYTDNKPELLAAITRSDERLSATELVAGTPASAAPAVKARRPLPPGRPPALAANRARQLRRAFAAWQQTRDHPAPSDRAREREVTLER